MIKQSDWPGWVLAIATVLGMVGGGIAWLTRAFRQRGTDQEKKQKERDDSATSNSDRTFEATFQLLDEFKKELARKTQQIQVAEDALATAQTLIVTLKSEIATLTDKVRRLERELKGQH